MKTNRFFMLFAAMVMTAAVSCNKEEFEGQGGTEDVTGNVASGVVFKATSEAPVTRTAIDGEGNVTWKAGDQVAFYWQVGGQYHEGETDYPYLSNALAEDGNEVEFKIDNASETFVNAFINNQKPTEGGRNLYAVYPATSTSTYYTDADHKALDITIPTEQEGTFESASIALAKWASATPTELKFRNLCALLKVGVADKSVRKIVVKSDSEIAGRMQLTFKDDEAGDYPVVAKVLEAANTVTVNVEETGAYYVAVRPGDIENLYIELQNEAGVVVGGQTAGRTLTAERANVYALSVTAPTDKLFVKTEAAGDGSGSSWDNAMTLASLEAYMESAAAVSKKVYIAAGTYLHRSAIQVKTTGFEIYGGFPATASGYDLTGRDVKANATIIDGGWGDENTENDKNARIFLLHKGTWMFDGITLQNINATNKSNGSAIQVIETDGVTIRNCNFINCKNSNTSYIGGALRIDAGNTVYMESCTFEQNQAQSGGAIYVAGTLNAKGCSFNENWANVNNGGAIYVDTDAVLNLDTCTFDSNIAKGADTNTGGGAIYSTGDLYINACDFDGNKASSNGGAMLLMGDAVARIDRTTFRTNAANGTGSTNGGGAVYMNDTSKLYMNRCFMANNKDKYNAHHIYTRAQANCVGINNSVIRGPFGETDSDKLILGSLLQLKGYSVVVNSTLYCRVSNGGAISLGTKVDDGCRIINDIIINNFTDHNLSFYNTSYKLWAYNTIYNKALIIDGETGTFTFDESCLAGADCTTNFPHADALWTNNGTKATYEDGRAYYYYDWDGTTDCGPVTYNTLDGIKTLVSGTAEMGEDFLTWLESDELKVNGVEALAVDIRGEARDTEAMWPGSYQEAVVASEPEADANAENFNVK